MTVAAPLYQISSFLAFSLVTIPQIDSGLYHVSDIEHRILYVMCFLYLIYVSVQNFYRFTRKVAWYFDDHQLTFFPP